MTTHIALDEELLHGKIIEKRRDCEHWNSVFVIVAVLHVLGLKSPNYAFQSYAFVDYVERRNGEPE